MLIREKEIAFPKTVLPTLYGEYEFTEMPLLKPRPGPQPALFDYIRVVGIKALL